MESPTKHVIVGTAGHIDHGKSALVLALTGTDPDRLEEEKRRGITIDLGFAHLDLGDGLRVAFVDVPGHERFIKNMLAGASGIDVVMLVVAADESIKPQTREHFDICKLLGVKHGLVVITKSDLVEPDLLEIVSLEVQEFVAGSFLEGAPIVAASSRTGGGLEALKSELRRLSLAVSPKPADLPFRLPIDRAFVMKGFGAVVTGTLVAGRIRKEAEVEIFPIGRRVRVRGVQVHNQSADEALAGQRTALNLAGVEAKDLARGMVLAEPGLFEATRLADCVVSLLPSARPLKNRARVHFHCGTAEMVAEVVLLDGSKELKASERAYVQLRLAESGLFLPGDRFIIRQFSPLTTLGGGAVLDSRPTRRRSGDPRAGAFLEVLERGDPESCLELLVRESMELPVAAAVARTGWAPREILRVAGSLHEKERVMILGQPPGVLVHTTQFETLAAAAIASVTQFHKSNPLLRGLSKEDLRGRLAAAVAGRRREGPDDQSPQVFTLLFDTVLDALVTQRKLEVQGETVRLAGQTIELTEEELNAKNQISRAFEVAGLTVPASAEVLAQLKVDRVRAEKILRILIQEKTLIKVAEGLIFHRTAIEKLRESLTQRKAEHNRIDVGGFKQMTGVSRKYAIPLLEYLDRERVTRRQGDERIIL